jgi:hypothetical protein
VASPATVTWRDAIDSIFDGDLVAGLGYRPPAAGAVVQAVAPIGLRDRELGTVGFTTSLGLGKKLERIAADPRVALAFHTRQHGTAASREYVLVQGIARVIAQPTPAQRKLVRAHASAHVGPPKLGPFWLDVNAVAGARYAPHTETGYRGPPNKTWLLLLNGAMAKRGVRRSRS